MPALRQESFDDRLPDQIEVRGAEQLLTILASQAKEDGQVELELADAKGQRTPVTLAPALSASLLELLRLVADGRGFTLVPLEAELTTKQAADHLNVSRPFLIKLLEEGQIPHHKVGRHRRVRAEDLFAYRDRRDADRSKALDELARLDADLI
ncbi:MAG: helix-turn-helix domain-containing protein [Erythrobacter sp.]|nr:helix-turn-helix domain-containing protein [Erythrobacter sp.]